jgi:tRNA(Ile)-lysidine synthase
LPRTPNTKSKNKTHSESRLLKPQGVKLTPLEFKVWRILQATGVDFQAQHLLLACSGGADSTAAAHILNKLSPRFGYKIGLVYVHHGQAMSAAIIKARDQAREIVRGIATQLGIGFHTNDEAPTEMLQSEDEFRHFRYTCLNAILQNENAQWLVLAHHSEDLLETRLIRLLRGTGPQGLRAMSVLRRQSHSRPALLRPLLSQSRADILAYLAAKKISYLSDPSNEDTRFFRNWLRKSWLVDLEKRRPGSKNALARSLDQIAGSLQPSVDDAPDQTADEILTPPTALDRLAYGRLGPSAQQSMIAAYLRASGVRNFTSKHILEVCKRLDSPRKRLTFQLLKRHWLVNAERICAVSVESIEVQASRLSVKKSR